MCPAIYRQMIQLKTIIKYMYQLRESTIGAPLPCNFKNL